MNTLFIIDLLPFLYHVGVEDLAALRNTAQPVSFAAGMQEMSLLCVLLGMLLLSLGMRKYVKERKNKETAEPAADAPAVAPAAAAIPAPAPTPVPAPAPAPAPAAPEAEALPAAEEAAETEEKNESAEI